MPSYCGFIFFGGLLASISFAVAIVDQSSDDFDIERSFAVLPNTATVSKSFTNLQNGTSQFFLTLDCLHIITEPSPFGINGTCWAQNPDAPYGLIMLPTHEEEVEDKYTGYPVVNKDNQASTWHLREGDVIVLMGYTPPKCRYFSFTNYLYSRYSPPDFVPDPTLSPVDGRSCLPGTENERCEYFASVSDTVNLDRGLNIGEDKYNTSFALLLSASITATELATQALLEASVPFDRISNFTFPGADLNLGDNTTADTFITLLRTAFYDDEKDKEQFFSSVPFSVLRMELNDDMPNILHTKTPYIPRKTGVRNDATLAGLTLDEMQDAIESLGRQVLENMTPRSTDIGGPPEWEVAITVLESGEPDTGDDCVARGQRCLADCRDTLYPFSINEYDRWYLCEGLTQNDDMKGKLRNLRDNIVCTSAKSGFLTQDDDDSMIVIGVNHKLSNMSTYASLAVYDLNYLWGVTGVGDVQLAGTAERFVDEQSLNDDPNLAKALPYLYAYEIKRKCSQEYEGVGCLTVPFEPTAENYQLYIPLSHSVGFAERMYDNPISHVGPAVDEVAIPILIHVKKRSN